MPRLDAQKLKTILESKNITQASVADHLGLDRGSVSHWINGKSGITTGNLQKLASFLQVDEDELLEEDTLIIVKSPKNLIILNNRINVNNLVVSSLEAKELISEILNKADIKNFDVE